MSPPPIKPGSRLLVVGQTGSGKTRGMIYHAVRQPLPIVILDTKIEGAFEAIPGATVSDGLDIGALYAHYDEHPDGAPVIIRPLAGEYEPGRLDAFLLALYDACEHACIVIDELYSVHVGTTAGPGLTALLTRGRSRGLTVIMGAQRPRRISLFCLSETDYYAVYRLRLLEDRARMAEAAGHPALKRETDRYFYWWVSAEGARLMSPVPVHIVAQKQPLETPLDKPRLNMI